MAEEYLRIWAGPDRFSSLSPSPLGRHHTRTAPSLQRYIVGISLGLANYTLNIQQRDPVMR